MSTYREVIELVDGINQLTTSATIVTTKDGRAIEAQRHTFENLARLKQLATTDANLLVRAFRETSDRGKRIPICDALQTQPSAELAPFFSDLFNDPDKELQACAAVALAKLQRRDLADHIAALASTDADRRYNFYIGMALTILSDKRGIDVLVAVLEDEEKDVESHHGRIRSSEGMPVYGPSINEIFKHLFGVEHGDPYSWIAWWKANGKTISKVETAAVPSHLLDYHHPVRPGI